MHTTLVVFGYGPVKFAVDVRTIFLVETYRLMTPEKTFHVADFEDAIALCYLFPSRAPHSQHSLAPVCVSDCNVMMLVMCVW